MNKNTNLKFKDYIAIILLLLSVIIVYFSQDIIDRIQEMDNSLEASQKASSEIAKLVLSLDKITLDTNILNVPYLQNLRTLPQFPIDTTSAGVYGKFNPFSGNFQVQTQETSAPVGAVQYATQRDEGTASIRTINVNQTGNNNRR